jgi:hypothetical protein
LGEFLHGTFAPRLFAVAATGVFLLAYYRLASVSEPSTPGPTYSWDTVVGETITDVEATVAGLRREYAEQKALYSKMYADTRELEKKLSPTTSMNR